MVQPTPTSTVTLPLPFYGGASSSPPTTFQPFQSSGQPLAYDGQQLPFQGGHQHERVQVADGKRDEKEQKEKKDKPTRGDLATPDEQPPGRKAQLGTSDPPVPTTIPTVTLGGSGGGDDPGGHFGGNGKGSNGPANNNNNQPHQHRCLPLQRRRRLGGDPDDGDDSSSNFSGGEHGHGHGGGGGGGDNDPDRRRLTQSRYINTSSFLRFKEADRISIKPCGNAGLARKWKMTVPEEVMVASGRGQLAWDWITEVEKDGQTFEGLADSGPDFVSLDRKLSVCIGSIVSGDVAQDIFNRMDSLAKVGKMITGRQKHFLYLGHLAYDEGHGFTYNVLSLTNLAFEGDAKLAQFLRRYDMIINGLSKPIEEQILRLNLYTKLKNATLLQHDLAWFKRVADPHDDNHQKVYTHDWLLKVVRGKIKAIELEINATSVLRSLSNPSSAPGMVGTQEQGNKDNKSNKGGAIDCKDVSDGACPPGPVGKGKGKNNDQAPKPPADERVAIVKEHADTIQKQCLCLKYNLGTCTKTDCQVGKHIYLSTRYSGKAVSEDKPPKTKKESTQEELADRAKKPCPYLSKPSCCSFGDKCHFNHDGTHGGVALARVALAGVARMAGLAPPKQRPWWDNSPSINAVKDAPTGRACVARLASSADPMLGSTSTSTSPLGLISNEQNMLTPGCDHGTVLSNERDWPKANSSSQPSVGNKRSRPTANSPSCPRASTEWDLSDWGDERNWPKAKPPRKPNTNRIPISNSFQVVASGGDTDLTEGKERQGSLPRDVGDGGSAPIHISPRVAPSSHWASAEWAEGDFLVWDSDNCAVAGPQGPAPTVIEQLRDPWEP